MGGGPELVGTHIGHRDNHVIGLRDGHQKTVLLHRKHILPISRHDLHRPAGILQVEEGHGGSVHQPQTDAVTRGGVQVDLAMAVGQEVVVGHIREVHGGHAEQLALEIIRQPALPEGPQKALGRTLFKGIPVAPPLQVAHHRLGAFRGPVGEHHRVVVVDGEPELRLSGLDHDGPMLAALLLEPGMGVVPVGAALSDGEPIVESGPRRDAPVGQVGHPVHGVGHEQAVPMDGGGLLRGVVHTDVGDVAFLKTQHGSRARPVDQRFHGGLSADLHGSHGHGQIVIHNPGPGGPGQERQRYSAVHQMPMTHKNASLYMPL